MRKNTHKLLTVYFKGSIKIHGKMALATDDFSAGELEGNMWNVEKNA